MAFAKKSVTCRTRAGTNRRFGQTRLISLTSLMKFVEDGDDIGMTEFIGKGNLGEQANSNIAQNCGPDRFDTVGPEAPPNRDAESTFSPHERPIRRLC